MKHAYLIMAHGEMELLPVLLQTIDDPRNDIFIHIDLKTDKIFKANTIHSRVHMIENRVDVRWGDVSQIETELVLFESALSSGESYSYFHLLSGVDLPLKSQNHIHKFFEDHAGKEFIGYSSLEITPEIERKVQRWHLFPRQFRSSNLFVRGLRSGFLVLQELVGYKRNKDMEFKKGANWVSVSDGMARYFVSRKEWLLSTFTHTFCGDEMAMQTLCWESPFRDNIYDLTDEWKGNLRLVGWKDGHLSDWTSDEWETIRNSNALFARKFNNSDQVFINKVVSLSLK